MKGAGLSSLAAVLILTALTGKAHAMPVFAQAYSANCTLCHTQVPALNAYGRYVQRSGYAVLDHDVLKRSVPIWIGFNPSYDSQGSPRTQVGNLAVHAAGVTGNWSYHVQQWITQNNAPGSIDTAWVAYNNFFDHAGHLFFGKVETPAPSPFSQWFDLAPFALSQVTVGEHQYQLANNRWGERFAYAQGSVDAEVAWLGGGDTWSSASDFTNVEKTVQWKFAWANPKQPVEAGVFGSAGSFPLAEGGVDPYHSSAVYAQRDIRFGVPGVFLSYQTTRDANPGGGDAASAGNDATVELFERFLHDNVLIGIRKEFTNDGLGNSLQSGNVDLEFHPVRFIHVYLETYMAQSSKPGYRYMLWWTTPVTAVK